MNKLILSSIKELLHDFNLPTCPVYKEGMRVIDDMVYIKDGQFVLCKVSNGTAAFIPTRPFTYGRKVINLTSNLSITNAEYDAHTHNYLGDYLRFQSDYNGINLMPLYNCCYGELLTNVKTDNIVTNSGVTYNINTDGAYKYVVVPVKLFKEYTIAIDSPIRYELACIFYDKHYSALSSELIKKSCKQVNGSLFSKPFLYTTTFDDISDGMIRLEPTLKLVIKLPKYISSSIVVLEGNYTGFQRVGNINPTTYYTYGDELGYKKLSLLEMNDRNQKYFSDLLPGYLLSHFITKGDKISENIERVQKTLKDYIGAYGLWDNKIPKLLENKLMRISDKNFIKLILVDGADTKTAKFRRYIDKYDDFIGFVDKNVEVVTNEIN